MIKEIRHTGIVVKNLDESLDFYSKKLGFHIVKKADESGPFINQILDLENVKVTTVKMMLNDSQMIELLDFKTHKKNLKSKQLCDIGPTHIAFTVENVDQIYEEFKENGVHFISQPAVSPDGYAKVVFCSAPEGTYIELVEIL